MLNPECATLEIESMVTSEIVWYVGVISLTSNLIHGLGSGLNPECANNQQQPSVLFPSKLG
jgi:hypothetical protein